MLLFSKWLSDNLCVASAKDDLQILNCEHNNVAQYYWEDDELTGVVLGCPDCIWEILVEYQVPLQIALRPTGYWAQRTSHVMLDKLVHRSSQLLAQHMDRAPLIAHIGCTSLCADVTSKVLATYVDCCHLEHETDPIEWPQSLLAIGSPLNNIEPYEVCSLRSDNYTSRLYDVIVRWVTEAHIWSPKATTKLQVYPCQHGMPTQIQIDEQGIVRMMLIACQFCTEDIFMESRLIHAKWLGRTEAVCPHLRMRGQGLPGVQAPVVPFEEVPNDLLMQQEAFVLVKELSHAYGANISESYCALCSLAADSTVQQCVKEVFTVIKQFRFDF